MQTIQGTIILTDSWMNGFKAREVYKDTPVWDPNSENIRGRSVHIGEGRWITRCAHCDAFMVHYGVMPRWRTIGPHEVEEHAAQVAGINVGILANA